ncbi:MAG: prolyl oligopeptidase family serine peptidase [Proteobacteria bacterium]|nr:prolyl oligopeptidase family serine peptidase [Pseudomonadota bacterium]
MDSRIRILIVFSFFVALIGYLKLQSSASTPKYALINYPLEKCAKSTETLAALKAQSAQILKRGQENAKLYDLKPAEAFKNINEVLLTHPNTIDAVKKAIEQKTHQFYVFSYYSDGLKVKGYLSVPNNVPGPIPLIILLRGGNRLLGLPIPDELSTTPGYAVLTTTYRGGVSEGTDEFGGKDVHDVINLLDNIPLLEKNHKIKFHEKNKYLIGVSRGAMELFLALNRYPEIQNKIRKVVSISGLLDLDVEIKIRKDFKDMLIENFGLKEGEHAKAWIANRNPVQNIGRISKSLPIMIVQGTDDTRICLKEGYDMLQALHDKGHTVTYVEIEGGDHALNNTPDFISVLLDWLEQ